MDHVLVHALVEEAVGIAPALLGLVEGGVGVAHQGLGIGAIRGEHRHADGEGGAQLPAVEVEGATQVAQNGLALGGDPMIVQHLEQDDEELVAGEPA